MEEMKYLQDLIRKPEEKRPLGRPVILKWWECWD
jgi:hypothetical protein